MIMADPPWDIHMELPYGTMSDDEMRQLNIPIMQDEGLIFLWVTGRLVLLDISAINKEITIQTDSYQIWLETKDWYLMWGDAEKAESTESCH